VLAGDGRLAERLRSDEFLPLASRMWVRLAIERAPPQALQDCLRHVLQQAGAPTLMTKEVIATVCDHAQGNLRALMIMAGELLELAAQRDARQIDETLFFEICAAPAASENEGGDEPASSSRPGASPIAQSSSAGLSTGCGPKRPSGSSAASQNAANPSWPSIWPSPSPRVSPACAASR
jgi:hypothetical protein